MQTLNRMIMHVIYQGTYKPCQSISDARWSAMLKQILSRGIVPKS